MSLQFKLTQSSGNHLSYGGFPLLQKLFAHNNLPDLLDSGLPRPASQAQYKSSDVVLSSFFAGLMGGTGLEDLNHVRDELQQVHGFQVPSADTLGNRLRKWSQKNREVFSGDHGRTHHSYNFATALNTALGKTAALSLAWTKAKGAFI